MDYPRYRREPKECFPAQALQNGEPGDGHEPTLTDLVGQTRQVADALHVVAGR
jgi:hypothetical protein